MVVIGVYLKNLQNIAMENTYNLLFIHYRFDPVALLIRLYSHSYYNHVAWILNKHLIIESTRYGIKINSINKYNNQFLFVTKKMKINLSETDKFEIDNYLINQIKHINYFDRFMSFLCVMIRKHYKRNTPTCSNFIATACSKIGICFDYAKDDEFITPGDIYRFYLKND